MSTRKLIERLNREADEQARAIRAEAEAEAEQVRAEARRETEAVALRYHHREAEAVGDKIAGIITEAEREAREIRQEIDEVLASRLRKMAFSSLSQMRGQEYLAVFKALAAEVPEMAWTTIRVNPADTAIATEIFPAMDIRGDDSITGGIEAASDGDRVRVVNTFEKRLERAWEKILPGLIAEVYETYAGD